MSHSNKNNIKLDNWNPPDLNFLKFIKLFDIFSLAQIKLRCALCSVMSLEQYAFIVLN
jgi:hypothetical protein